MELIREFEKIIQKEARTNKPLPILGTGINEIIPLWVSYVDLNKRWSLRADNEALQLYNIDIKTHEYNKKLFENYINGNQQRIVREY